MKKINPMLLLDGYKLGHRKQYPNKTTKVYDTYTPRNSRVKDYDSLIFVGLQKFIKKWLIDYFNEHFFGGDIEAIVLEYKTFITAYLGEANPDVEHIYALHELGYLPIKICALDEGTRVPMRVPMFTVESTHPDFYFLPNMLETLISSETWYIMTSANTSDMYKKIACKYAEATGVHSDFVPFTAHDFSFRGQHSFDSATHSGLGHLFSFIGTDTCPAILDAVNYYNADLKEEIIGKSVNATEHAVMCAGTKDSEYDTYKRLLTEVYPTGILSIVSDTWDYWGVLTNVIPQLKDVILNREGTCTIRPDSGDPFKIICGDKDSEVEHIRKGTIEVLWDIFGGTINDKGFKVLDTHISTIYGEAIQPELMERILKELKKKGFASSNVLFGVGSYGFLSAGVTKGIATRDTYGIAIKATYVVVDGEERLIFKDPKTDDGLKKSQKGMVAVIEDGDGNITYIDGLYEAQKKSFESRDLLQPVFVDGKLVKETSLAEIRERLK